MEKKKVPVIQEEVKVGKRPKRSGVLRVRKRVHDREELVEQPLLKEEAVVTRVPVNRYLETPAEIREEDGVIIVPLMEEVAVVEKRLLLKEEIRIQRRKMEVREHQKIVLRSEEAVIEHSGK